MGIDKIIQLVPAFHYGDAIGESIRSLRRWLNQVKIENYIYSLQIDDILIEEAKLYPNEKPESSDNSLIILHYALPSELSRIFVQLRGKKILLYHNITPPEYFLLWEPELALLTLYGKEELKSLKEVPDLALADSEYNRKELEALGFKNTMVCPIWIPFELYENKYNEILSDMMKDKENFLFVGRIVPNKKIEDIIKIVYWYKENLNANIRLILVGKYNTVPRYYYWLKEYAKGLNLSDEDIYFTGHVSYEELATYYKISKVFISMSDHEGFCVPLVEAMYFSLPVIAYESAAVPEIMDTAGVVVKTKQFEYIAELINIILIDKKIKESIITSQKKRLEYFSKENMEKRWRSILDKFL